MSGAGGRSAWAALFGVDEAGALRSPEIFNDVPLPNGRSIDAYRLTFHRARLCLRGEPWQGEYEDVWDYDDEATLADGVALWVATTGGDGEPGRWSRHPRSGRRRPGGDAEKEYVLR